MNLPEAASQSLAVLSELAVRIRPPFGLNTALLTAPVLAASVKTDLVAHTLRWRRSCGRVWLYDPSRCTGLRTSPWSPLQAASHWSGARRVAHWATLHNSCDG